MSRSPKRRRMASRYQDVGNEDLAIRCEALAERLDTMEKKGSRTPSWASTSSWTGCLGFTAFANGYTTCLTMLQFGSPPIRPSGLSPISRQRLFDFTLGSFGEEHKCPHVLSSIGIFHGVKMTRV
jgi:hypothetical protein